MSAQPEALRWAAAAEQAKAYVETLKGYAIFDDEGLLRPTDPFSWETLARIAVDFAVAKVGEQAAELRRLQAINAQMLEALIAADLAFAQNGLLACHATRHEISTAIAAAKEQQ